MRLIRATIVAAALTLGGCATPGGAPAPGPTVGVNDVIALSKTICSFVPTVSTVISLITANPAWTSVSDFAVAICNAVTSKSARRSSRGQPMVGGVVIRGRFER